MSNVILLDENTRGYCGIVAWAKSAAVAGPGTDWDKADLFVTHTEYGPCAVEIVGHALRAGVPTLHLADGVIEWRNTWEHPPLNEERREFRIWQPVLCDKFACLGEAQARTVEAWGNREKCEVVGAPRLDALTAIYRAEAYMQPRERTRLAILVASAKTPAFQQADAIKIVQSFRDLRSGLQRLKQQLGISVEVKWRIAPKFYREVGLTSAEQLSGAGDLQEVIKAADIVICTPSTLMLEAMLLRRAVIRLDYTNSPQYLRTAWNISAPEHIESELRSVLEWQPQRWCFQDEALRDELQVMAPAAQKLEQLAETMIAARREARTSGTPCRYAPAILPRSSPSGGSAARMSDLFVTGPPLSQAEVNLQYAENFRLRTQLEREREAFERRMNYMQSLVKAPARTMVLNGLERVFRRLLRS